MSDPSFQGFEDLSGEPLEVRLVGDTTACRSCNWFWRPPPYGPYPAFDFAEDYPSDLQQRSARQHTDGDHVRTLEGKSQCQQIVHPQILHGCRKAPVMTIGINPNLTGFWPGTNGARWAYPSLSSFRRYAYYYRHRTVHQESFPLEFIRQHIREDGALVARKAGRIVRVDRAWAAREMTVSVVYQDGDEETIEQAWDAENHFVLLFDRSFDGERQFEAGDLIGGFLDLPKDADVAVEQNVVGYYQRVIPILEQVSAYLRSRGEIPDLQMAEDICQLDMVACASPGWGSKLEIDKREVARECIYRNRWMIKQLLQTRPSVIVFSGRSAFQLFNRIFKPFVTPSLHDDMDVYGLMKYTARDPHYLDIRKEVDGHDYSLRARLIISPHFSYDDNFMPHARLSAEEWAQFTENFPEASAELLSQEGRVSEANRDGYRGIRVDGLGDLKTRREGGVIALMRKLFDASKLIGEGIAQEILLGGVGFNRASRHLERSQGPCHFCVNDQWQFPEGCAYGKPDEALYPPSLLEAVADYVESSLAKDVIEP